MILTWAAMTTGLVLVLAVLILGGVIATAGDRIGMRVGKARLSLFRLRPRQTATLITILTGCIISATTLGLLFAVSEQLRTGVFELEQIQEELTQAQEDLTDVQVEKRQIEDELAQSRQTQREARQQLRDINQSLRQAIARQERSEAELGRVESNYQQAQTRLQQITQQAANLRSEIAQLQTESRELLGQRDRAIAAKEQEIAEKEQQLQALEIQRTVLVQELLSLEREIQALREGDVALLNNQLLASGIVRIVEPQGSRQAIDALLQQANRTVLQEILPGTQAIQSQVVQITSTEVESLIERLQPGQDYVIRIVSGGNYLVGEPCVLAGRPCIQVGAEAVPNQLVFQPGEVIAAATLPPSVRQQEELVERLELLLAAAQFRARQAGVLGDQVQIALEQEVSIEQFFQQLLVYQQTHTDGITIQAIANNAIYTAGPLALRLVTVPDLESTPTESNLTRE